MSPRPVLIPRLLRRGILAAVLAVVVSSGPAQAAFVAANSTVNIQGSAGTSGPGFFTGVVEVDNQTDSQASIRISLTNTSPLSNGGYLMAFAFNDPGSSTLGNLSRVTAFSSSYSAPPNANLGLIGATSTTSNFSNDTISTGPFGNYDLGAGVGGQWHTAGLAVEGIDVGQTGVFTFDVTGSGLNSLTATTIATGLSTTNVAGIAVRFRGFSGTPDNDKVISSLVYTPQPPPPTGVVPAPPAFLLGLIGMGGCLLGRRFRRQTIEATKC